MSVAEAFKRLGPVRARTWALLALLAVAALVLLAPGVRTSDVRSETEARLERVLSEVEGAGRVKVMVFEGTDGQTGVLVAAMACMIGHCFPVYYRFRGGKGVAVGAAIALLLSPRAFGVMLTTFLLAFLFTHRVSVGSIAGATMFPISLLIFGERDVLTLVCAGFVTVMVWFMHRENLKRLAAGTEPEFTFGKAQGTDKEDRK